MKAARGSFSSNAASMRASVPSGNLARYCSSLIRFLPIPKIEYIHNSGKTLLSYILYYQPKKAVADGSAKASALWVFLSDEHSRDGYGLKPMPWEGTGEYQHVTFNDGRDGFVRTPDEGRPLPVARHESSKKAKKVGLTEGGFAEVFANSVERSLPRGWEIEALDIGEIVVKADHKQVFRLSISIEDPEG